MKYRQNENPIKSNINCEKYTKDIKLYDKAEIIFLKKSQKYNNHTLWCRHFDTKLLILR